MLHVPLLFNDVDGYEVLVIILVVLIFFGPKSIPGIAKTLGRAIYSVKNASQEIQNEIKKSGAELRREIKVEDILKEEEIDIVNPLDQQIMELDQSIRYDPNTSAQATQEEPSPITSEAIEASSVKPEKLEDNPLKSEE